MNSKKFDKYKYKSVTTVLSQVYSEYINVDHYEMIETTKWVLAVSINIKKSGGFPDVVQLSHNTLL